MKYSYQYEKLSQIRRLMLVPKQSQIALIVADAFHECDLCLSNIDPNEIGFPASEWIEIIRRAMDISTVSGSDSLYLKKAQAMSNDEIIEFAHAIDELCDYFHSRNHA